MQINRLKIVLSSCVGSRLVGRIRYHCTPKYLVCVQFGFSAAVCIHRNSDTCACVCVCVCVCMCVFLRLCINWDCAREGPTDLSELPGGYMSLMTLVIFSPVFPMFFACVVLGPVTNLPTNFKAPLLPKAARRINFIDSRFLLCGMFSFFR